MKPYRHLQANDVRGVIFDIDDTVTRRGIVERQAYSAMHDLSEAGLLLIAVTGRPLGWTDVIAHHWPVDVAIGENGAGWTSVQGGRVAEGYFDTATIRDTQQALLRTIRNTATSQLPFAKVTRDQIARRCDLAFDVGEEESLSDDEISKLVGVIEEMGARSSVSTVHAHAIPGAWSKAVGSVRAARDVLGIDLDSERDRWVFVGDSGNDAEAFAYFPHSVGVANVHDHLDRLPSAPAYVTDGDRGRGFAEVAAHLLESRG